MLRLSCTSCPGTEGRIIKAQVKGLDICMNLEFALVSAPYVVLTGCLNAGYLVSSARH